MIHKEIFEDGYQDLLKLNNESQPFTYRAAQKAYQSYRSKNGDTRGQITNKGLFQKLRSITSRNSDMGLINQRETVRSGVRQAPSQKNGGTQKRRNPHFSSFQDILDQRRRIFSSRGQRESEKSPSFNNRSSIIPDTRDNRRSSKSRPSNYQLDPFKNLRIANSPPRNFLKSSISADKMSRISGSSQGTKSPQRKSIIKTARALHLKQSSRKNLNSSPRNILRGNLDSLFTILDRRILEKSQNMTNMDNTSRINRQRGSMLSDVQSSSSFHSKKSKKLKNYELNFLKNESQQTKLEYTMTGSRISHKLNRSSTKEKDQNFQTIKNRILNRSRLSNHSSSTDGKITPGKKRVTNSFMVPKLPSEKKRDPFSSFNFLESNILTERSHNSSKIAQEAINLRRKITNLSQKIQIQPNSIEGMLSIKDKTELQKLASSINGLLSFKRV